MQVILKADVDHLGFAKDVVDVKRGYWRNYLRPRGLAETATSGKMAELMQRTERLRAAEARNVGEAAELKELLDRTVITVQAHAGPQGKLFGSVTAVEIAKAIDSVRKLRIDHRKVQLAEPIKTLGTFMVPVQVFAGVTAEVQMQVVQASASEEELARMRAAAAQAKPDAIAAADKAEAAAEAATAAAAAAAAAPAEEAPAAEEAGDPDAVETAAPAE
ncbi:MAG: 50S ribosomal protein L9 [Thermoleophilia bacterium]|nr:50S ribosomal protein L9 [Thermoleophilia bacterium]